MDADVKNAIIELAGFYGMTVGDEYLKKILGGEAADSALSAAVESAAGNPATHITEDRSKHFTIQKIADKIKDYSDVEKHICITADSGTAAASIDSKLLNVFDKPGDQGKGKPAAGTSSHYTLDDMRPSDNQSDDKDTPVHVVQVFKANHAPTSANTELVALWLNSIPALEMSRAVPFLDIRVILKDPSAGEKKPKYMSLGSFLLGDKELEGDSANMIKADYLSDIEKGAAQIGDDLKPLEQPTNKNVVSSMDVFTSPQTMLGSKPHDNSDPFRPFMSLVDFNVDLAPAGGMMAFQTATMNMILHDRTRLKDVLGLVAPSNIGKTQIQVSYGWSHPEHSRLGRLSDASTNNRFAKLINAMKSSEIYTVTSTDYKFTDSGEIEIEAKLALAGSGIATAAEITSGFAESKEAALDKLFESIREVMSQIRNKQKKIGKVSFPKYVMSSTNVGGASMVSAKQLKKVRYFIKKSKRNKNPDYKELGKLLNEVYKKNGELAGLKLSKLAILTNMLTLMTKNADPFLPRRRIGNIQPWMMRVNKKHIESSKQSYVSLGKLFSVFIAEAYKSAGQDFSEIQLIFYPCNESASFAHSLNLAQFPIPIADFKKIMLLKFDITKSMTIGNFLRVLNSFYIRDQGNPVYGMNDLFGNRVKKDKKTTSERKIKKKLRKDNKFNEAKIERLAVAYGAKDIEKADLTFRMPQITLKFDCLPGEGLDDPKAAPILRIHVMDQAAGKAEQLKDVLMGFGGDGFFQKKTRNTDDSKTDDNKAVRTPMHGQVVEDNIKALGDMIEEVDGGEGIYAIKTSPDGDSLAFNLKDKIKTMFPSITYGAANSNIITADLGTVADASISSIMLMRQDKADDDNDSGEEGGLPLQIMPTQLSIETYGCPHVSFGQQLFIDFGTNTTADNFYAVTSVEHKFAPGEFKTDIGLVQLDGFGTFRSALSSLKKLKLELAKADSEVKS